MCVHPRHWRQGQGRVLLGCLRNSARMASWAHKVESLVRTSSTPALALYRAFGCLGEGRHRDRVRLQGRPFADDIAMALRLALP